MHFLSFILVRNPDCHVRLWHESLELFFLRATLIQLNLFIVCSAFAELRSTVGSTVSIRDSMEERIRSR